MKQYKIQIRSQKNSQSCVPLSECGPGWLRGAGSRKVVYYYATLLLNMRVHVLFKGTVSPDKYFLKAYNNV
jgi:hypothetical protein